MHEFSGSFPNRVNDRLIEVPDFNYNTMLKSVFPMIFPLSLKAERDVWYSLRVFGNRFFQFQAKVIDEKIIKLENLDFWILALITGDIKKETALRFLCSTGFRMNDEIRCLLFERKN